MCWYVRPKEDAHVYNPRECPDYTDHDYFSIKLFNGGELKQNPKTYVGGSVDYIDMCNVDKISLIEIMSMVKDCGGASGALTFWYKLPGTDMERGLFELDSDDEVLTMCSLLPECGYIEVYVIITYPLSQSTDAQHELHFNDSRTCPPKISDDIRKAVAERITSQPKETTVRCKKTGHNTISSAESKPEKLSESRRKRKLVFSNEQNVKKKSATLWSKEDDISLLKGMVDYEVQKQSNPYDDMGKFFEFVKPFIHFDVRRKQIADRLWRLKDKYIVTSKFDSYNPHNAKLFKLSKMIKAWGHDVDGGKGESVAATGDDQKVEENVVVDDFDCGKRSKVVKNKKKGKVVISKGQNAPEDNVDNVVVGDMDGDKCSKVVINKKKGKVEISEGQNVDEDHVVEDEVDGGKSKQLVKDKKEKFVINDRQNEKLVVNDVNSCKGSKADKEKKSGAVVISDGQNVEAENVVVDDVGGGKCAKELKDKKKRKVVISYGQSAKKNGKKRVKVVGNDVEEENVFVDEVGGGKSSEVVKDKEKREVVFSDGQSAKKNGKERVKVVGNENVAREVLKKDLKDFTSMYPHLTKSLELETQSMMPLHIKKDLVMDLINSIGMEKANELEGKWADLLLMESELHAKKLDMTNMQIKVILEAMRT